MHGKARKRITLGKYPAMTLQKAREAARLKISNPLGLPADNASISAAVEKYLAAISVKDRTHRDYTRLLNLHLKTNIGHRRLEDVTPREIIAITDKLKDTPAERYHSHAAMQTFFNWCVPRYIPISPMAGLKNPSKPNERERILTDDELKAVWNAAGDLGNYGVVVRLICLLGLRKGEPIGPKTLTKTLATFIDTKNNKDHILPITPYMHELLSQVKFTNGWSKNKARLDKLAKVTDYTHHDLRRTVGSNLCRFTTPFISERVLNHEMPKVQRIYNRHDFTEQMRKPLEDHQNWLLSLAETG
jgi:integrase